MKLNKFTITEVDAFTIFDSRGTPTIEVIVKTSGNHQGVGIVPSGASTGRREALELRDGNHLFFGGKSVNTAILNIREKIAPAITGMDIRDQRAIDNTMIELDASANKSTLGANAILGVSMAVCRAGAATQDSPLFQYLSEDGKLLLPLPEIQIIGGGAHSAKTTDIQDFMIICHSATHLMEVFQMTYEVYQMTRVLLDKAGKRFGVADEGGFWPHFDNHEMIWQCLVNAIELAGYRPGQDISISVDLAASEYFKSGQYHLSLDNQVYHPGEYRTLLDEWLNKYPVCSVEDPFAEDDPDSWKNFAQKWSEHLQIIGDDLFVTNPTQIKNGIDDHLANSVLIKPNQIGTISETLDAIRITKEAGWHPVVSARSGETEDAFISHLAVATCSGQLKVGSFTRSERMVKWNELLRIEHDLKGDIPFAGTELTFPWS